MIFNIAHGHKSIYRLHFEYSTILNGNFIFLEKVFDCIFIHTLPLSSEESFYKKNIKKMLL